MASATTPPAKAWPTTSGVFIRPARCRLTRLSSFAVSGIALARLRMLYAGWPRLEYERTATT
jgi:hypothetical protein